MENLTRTGTVGLELTREEVIDIKGRVDALLRKAQCREVNTTVLDLIYHVGNELMSIDDEITSILEDCE